MLCFRWQDFTAFQKSNGFLNSTISKGPFFNSILLSIEAFSSCVKAVALTQRRIFWPAVYSSTPHFYLHSSQAEVPVQCLGKGSSHPQDPSSTPCLQALGSCKGLPRLLLGFPSQGGGFFLSLSFLFTLFPSVQPLSPVPPCHVINFLCSFRQLVLLGLHPL